MMSRAAMTIFFAFVCATCAQAHDVWITLDGDPAARRAIVNYGHPDDRPPTQPDKIVDFLALGGSRGDLSDGMTTLTRDSQTIVASKPFADDGHMLLAARYDNGFWMKFADGHYRNVTRRLAPEAVEGLWSAKFAKGLTGAGAPWDKMLGHPLELVPLSDPVMLRVGDSLRLRVMFDGKPLAGAKVERGDGVTPVPEDDIPRFATDQDGVATIPMVKTGPQLLVVDHRVSPSKTPALADADLTTATLWFALR